MIGVPECIDVGGAGGVIWNGRCNQMRPSSLILISPLAVAIFKRLEEITRLPREEHDLRGMKEN
jgi:hypothetical protein